MQYSELTEEQKGILDSFGALERGWIGDLARLMQKGDILKDSWLANVSAIVTSLDAGAVIPNSSSLAGVEDLTKEELQSLGTYINTILTDNNTAANRQLWSRVAGPDNLIG